jgi:uncharacterized protein YigE (DUF2233 family)
VTAASDRRSPKPALFALCVFALCGLSGRDFQAATFSEWLAYYSTHRDEIKRHSAGDLTVKEIAAGPASDRAGLTLVWTELPSSGVTLNVRDVRRYGAAYNLYSDEVPKSAVAAINGGFFGYDKAGKHMPIGLVISNEQVKSPVMRWTTGGVLAQDKSRRVQIVEIHRPRPPSLTAAIQSKPLLVERGAVAIRGEDPRFNRSGVALTQEGTLILAGAFESFGRAVTLKEFAEFLVALRIVDTIHVETALAMDGGPGAQLYFPTLDRHYGDHGDNYIPNILYMTRPDSRK